MTWLNENSEAIASWLRLTACPMAATTEERFLWANDAFCDLIGYTLPELLRESAPTWRDLTVDTHELAADIELMDQCKLGRRRQYRLRKRYRHKEGHPVPGMIHVIRHPEVGEWQFFLVSLQPCETHGLTEEVERLRRHLARAEAEAAKPKLMDKMAIWASGNPVKAAAVGIFIAAIVMGDRVIEVARAIKDLIWSQKP